jgi:hypothetical protein
MSSHSLILRVDEEPANSFHNTFPILRVGGGVEGRIGRVPKSCLSMMLTAGLGLGGGDSGLIDSFSFSLFLTVRRRLR